MKDEPKDDAPKLDQLGPLHIVDFYKLLGMSKSQYYKWMEDLGYESPKHALSPAERNGLCQVLGWPMPFANLEPRLPKVREKFQPPPRDTENRNAQNS